jgi:subtilisin family serine protease
VIAYRGALGDKHGHGTHVAGSIAGNSNLAPSLDGTGGRTKEHNGAAPHAKLIVEGPLSSLPGLDPLRR